MRKFSRDTFNITEVINELMHESGVIVVENIYNLNEIESLQPKDLNNPTEILIT